MVVSSLSPQSSSPSSLVSSCTSRCCCAWLCFQFKPSMIFLPYHHGSPGSSSRLPPTHPVLRVPPRPVSSAPMGFIYVNGTDFICHYLTPLASPPDTVPSPPGREVFPFDPGMSRWQGVLCTPLPVRSVGCFLHPCRECHVRPCPSRHSFCGASSPQSRRGYNLGCTFAMGFGCGDLVPPSFVDGGHFRSPSSLSLGSSYILSSRFTWGGGRNMVVIYGCVQTNNQQRR